jgi:hypothetical protein
MNTFALITKSGEKITSVIAENINEAIYKLSLIKQLSEVELLKIFDVRNIM